MYSRVMIQIRLIPITKTGFNNLLIKRDNLLSQRPEAVKTLKAARELGDLSENGLYRSARSRLSGIDAELRRLNMQIKLSEIIEPKTSNLVQIGSSVTVLENGKEKTYRIVGDIEANPKEKKTSTRSPIGHALVGKKVGDEVIYNAPKAKISLKIIKIEI